MYHIMQTESANIPLCVDDDPTAAGQSGGLGLASPCGGPPLVVPPFKERSPKNTRGF